MKQILVACLNSVELSVFTLPSATEDPKKRYWRERDISLTFAKLEIHKLFDCVYIIWGCLLLFSL